MTAPLATQGLATEEIRQRFLTHFTSREHTLVPSASLIATDPTLLLVNAGMVPFKPYFLGEQAPPWPRATSVQKCVRTVDIENVGLTVRHGSFFQMCGNFSFGDYFKDKAIPLAWEFVTGAAGLALPEDRLWVTVFEDDDEAAEIWIREVGVSPDRVQRFGRADNFWSMGVPGPCGPCSEIFWDRGPQTGRDGGPLADEDRYMEFWNLVFMQFERGEGQGKDFPLLGELPQRNIDTGLGLERVSTILQGVESLYDIDINRPVLDRAADLAGRRYGSGGVDDVRLRVIADHTRTAVMLIADGVLPGNEGRGYVLRRMLRRAVRTLRLLGVDEPAMGELVPVVRDSLGASYPELVTDFPRILSYAEAEELAFRATLRAGTTVLDTAITEAKASPGASLPGDVAFRLHDTHGFPVELTLEIAAEAGLSVDEEGFRRLMAQQRSLAKADTQRKKVTLGDASVLREALAAAGPTAFTGYTELARESRLSALVGPEGLLEAAIAGDEVDVVLDVTPFYAEGGGQIADLGVLRADGAELEVLDVQRPLPDLVVHRCRVLHGEVRAGGELWAQVDPTRRAAISRSHTATHLVHRAFRGLLGESATQAGSLNAPGRLRFDFANPSAVPASVLADVEDEVNERLQDDLEVRWFVTSQAEARRIGAMALFGEKYGEQVRVVEVGDYARELCGGTHVARSGQLGLVKLLGESSIGAGVRRVEALVGLDAFRHLAREHVIVSRLAGALKVPADQVPDRVAELVDQLRGAERELEKVRSGALLAGADTLAAAATDVGGVLVVAQQAPAGIDGGELRKLALEVRGKLPPGTAGVVALASATDGAGSLVVALTEPARARGLSAGALVREAAVLLGGRGGGSDEVAQGGGPLGSGVEGALDRVRQLAGSGG